MKVDARKCDQCGTVATQRLSSWFGIARIMFRNVPTGEPSILVDTLANVELALKQRANIESGAHFSSEIEEFCSPVCLGAKLRGLCDELTRRRCIPILPALNVMVNGVRVEGDDEEIEQIPAGAV